MHAATIKTLSKLQGLQLANELRRPDSNGNTPLHLACSKGNDVFVQYIFDRDLHLDMGKQNDDGDTCLSLAVKSRNNKLLERILSQSTKELDKPNKQGMYPLHYAATHRLSKYVNVLLDAGADPDVLNQGGETPLHIAAQYGRNAVAKKLLKCGASIEAKDKEGNTPFLTACQYGRSSAIKLLLKHNADINVRNNQGKTAVFIAEEENQKDVLKIRLKKQADVFSTNAEKRTPLHAAAISGNISIVQILLNANISMIEHKDNAGNTALHLAASNDHSQVVKLLLQRRANVDSSNTQHRRPLHFAAKEGRIKTCIILLEAGSSADGCDKDRLTPLHLAAEAGHTEIIEKLIEWNAQLTMRDSKDRSVLDVAIDNEKEAVAAAIIKSAKWEDALRSCTKSHKLAVPDSPMRKLIRKMPGVAKLVLDGCITHHNAEATSEATFSFNYEFIDDLYSLKTYQDKKRTEAYDSSTGKVKKDAETYTANPWLYKRNHPLSIMVAMKRTTLLSHPLVAALLRRKWRQSVGAFFYANIIIYFIYLALVSGYMVNSTAPYSYNQTCETLAAANVMTQSTSTKSVGYTITSLALIRIIVEVLTMVSTGWNLKYLLNVETWLRWVIYISSMLLVMDLDGCQEITGYKYHWQWNLGAAAVFLAWINFALLVQINYGIGGIYVLMFKKIFLSVCDFAFVLIIILLAFVFAFNALFQNQGAFSTGWWSLIKTSVMLVGELGYMSILDETNTHHYGVMSNLLLYVFLVIMSIIIFNMLIGLAIEDIQEVKKQAEITRTQMVFDLVLDVEKMVPECVWRRVIVKKETLTKTNKNINRVIRFFRRKFGLHSIGLDDVQTIFSKLRTEKDEEGGELPQLRTTVDDKDVRLQVTNLVDNVNDVGSRVTRLEKMMAALMKGLDIEYEESDDEDSDASQ